MTLMWSVSNYRVHQLILTNISFYEKELLKEWSSFKEEVVTPIFEHILLILKTAY